jgi:hypothetical protein
MLDGCPHRGKHQFGEQNEQRPQQQILFIQHKQSNCDQPDQVTGTDFFTQQDKIWGMELISLLKKWQQ